MSKHILIAEDDRFLLESMKVALEKAGHTIITATDGRKTIEAIKQKKPNMLLLDLIMPEVDGFVVLEHCKNEGYTFPVIIISNVSSEIDQKKCRQLGAKSYLMKSDLEPPELLSKLEKYL